MNEAPLEDDTSQPRKSKRRAQRDKKIRVISYLAILFAAAFLLLLLSYLMQQRASELAQSQPTPFYLETKPKP